MKTKVKPAKENFKLNAPEQTVVDLPELAPVHEAANPDKKFLNITVSKSLHTKLQRTASEEGLSIDELAGELLAESIIVRSWEIIERKLAMRADNSNSQGNSQQRNHFHRNNNHHKRGGNRRMGGQGGFNSNMMDDRASFMEYVRKQDPNRR